MSTNATWRSANLIVQHILSDEDIMELIISELAISTRYETQFVRDEPVLMENGSVQRHSPLRKQVKVHGYTREQSPSLLAQVCKTLYNIFAESFVARWLWWKLRAHTFGHRLTWLGDGYGPSTFHSRTLIKSQANDWHHNGYTEWRIVNVEDRLRKNSSTSNDHSLRDFDLPVSIGHRNYRHLKTAPNEWPTPTQDFLIRFGPKAEVLATTFKPTDEYPSHELAEVYKYIGSDVLAFDIQHLHLSHVEKASTGLVKPPIRAAFYNPQFTFVPKMGTILRRVIKFDSVVSKSEIVKYCNHWPINKNWRNRPYDVCMMSTVLGRLDISESDVKSAALWGGNCTRRMPLKVYTDEDAVREYLCVQTEALIQVEISVPGGIIVLRGDVRYDFQLKNEVNKNTIFGSRKDQIDSEVLVAQEWLRRALNARSSLAVPTPI